MTGELLCIIPGPSELVKTGRQAEKYAEAAV